METSRRPEDVFKIMIATDIHLGYLEKDPIRGDDSFITFEEILKTAHKNNVDFILLGGDLFHESKPSPSCLHRCLVLLRRYCLGDKPVEIEYLSDQSLNFQHLPNPIVNYEDPNINVSIPVFSIHGNHDDPTGEKSLSAMDLLADTALLNYFGKWTDLTKIDISPVLLRKGITRLGMYGLSHIKDERLSRLFKDHKVSMKTPADVDSWFNIMILHQNRADNRGAKNFIPTEVLPEFLDLTVWGHEHDCHYDVDPTPNSGCILQPGSSVATSLAQGESIPKHVFLLSVYKKEYKIKPCKLNTVRPFVFKSLEIKKENPKDGRKINQVTQDRIKEIIEQMITEAKALISGDQRQPKLPLIRLIAMLEDEQQQFNQIRMGQQYSDRVANPDDMLVLKVKSGPRSTFLNGDVPADLDDVSADEEKFGESVEKLIEQYFQDDNVQQLSVLSVRGLTQAVSNFIEKGNTEAFTELFVHQTGKVIAKLEECDLVEDLNEEEIDKMLEKFRKEREARDEDEFIPTSGTRQSSPGPVFVLSDDDDDVSLASGSIEKPKPVRGRGRGSRGPRKPKAASTSTRSRGRSKMSTLDSFILD